jgi:hypothetical protein
MDKAIITDSLYTPVLPLLKTGKKNYVRRSSFYDTQDATASKFGVTIPELILQVNCTLWPEPC